MARKPSVRYWQSRGGFCCWLDGVQHLLASGPDDSPAGPTFLTALDRFKSLLQHKHAEAAGDGNTAGIVCARYLDFIVGRRKPSTYTIRQSALTLFLAAGFKDRRVGEITLASVYGFIDRKRAADGWGDSYCRIVLDSVRSAFNWAKKTGLIKTSPVAGIELPSARKRSAEVVLSAEQKAAVFTLAGRWLRPILVCLDNSGARPGEIVNATAADFDPTIGALVYKSDDRRREDEFSHKTGRKGRDRVVFFTGEALDIVRELAASRRSGPLFLRKRRGPTGERLPHSVNSLGANVNYLAKRAGIPGLTPYSFRHTFATRWLESGRSIDILAELLGNTASTIRKHYSHLCGNPAGLRSHLEGFHTEGWLRTANAP